MKSVMGRKYTRFIRKGCQSYKGGIHWISLIQTLEDKQKRLGKTDVLSLEEKMNKIAKNSNLIDTKQCIELASLAIFLNKTCFNGLWRMNASEDFNVPEGDYTRPKNIAQEDILLACQKQLNNQ